MTFYKFYTKRIQGKIVTVIVYIHVATEKLQTFFTQCSLQLFFYFGYEKNHKFQSNFTEIYLEQLPQHNCYILRDVQLNSKCRAFFVVWDIKLSEESVLRAFSSNFSYMSKLKMSLSNCLKLKLQLKVGQDRLSGSWES